VSLQEGWAMGLLGILIALGLLMWVVCRGWSVLLLAPAAALLAAVISCEPLLAHWAQIFSMGWLNRAEAIARKAGEGQRSRVVLV